MMNLNNPFTLYTDEMAENLVQTLLMPKIFTYTDYRKFISDALKYKKSSAKNFSYRSFCKRAGIASSGYLSNLLSGRRNLAETGIRKISMALGLNENEQCYLRYLTLFTHTNNPDERMLYQKMLNTYRMDNLQKAPAPESTKELNIKVSEFGFQKLLRMFEGLSEDIMKILSTDHGERSKNLVIQWELRTK